MKIEKARAVISGGASGLGRAVARHVVDAGGKAVLLDVNEDLGNKTAAELGDAAAFVRTDISSEEDVNAAIAKAKDIMGSITLAMNCAGVIGAGRVLGRDGPMPGDLFANTIKINLIGSFFLTKAAANEMQHNEPDENGDRGVVVSTASIAAYEGQIGQAAYSASKGGIVGMTLPIARELGRIGVRVMTIAPGIFLTPMMDALPEKIQESLSAQVPYPQRLGRPEEFADLVAYIYKNAYLNGEVIRLDGGIRMQPK